MNCSMFQISYLKDLEIPKYALSNGFKIFITKDYKILDDFFSCPNCGSKDVQCYFAQNNSMICWNCKSNDEYKLILLRCEYNKTTYAKAVKFTKSCDSCDNSEFQIYNDLKDFYVGSKFA